jgi:TolB-like protein/Tfp pilus assembly protein PilF
VVASRTEPLHESKSDDGLSEAEIPEATSATAAAGDPFVGLVVSHYRLEERLDAGGMGVVYRATDQKLGRSVLVKLLARHLAGDQTAKARFIREAQTASALDHPNLGTVHDICEQDGEIFIVLALYDGETLSRRLERGRLPVDEALGILRQVLLGLEAAHGAGIVHRDIKPENVLVTRKGIVKILDFGLAKLLSDSQAQAVTEAGQAMGTVKYMSPEQLRGQAVDSRTDLWAFGVLAYELLSGVSPFQADSSASTAIRVLQDEPPSLGAMPGVPDWLADLVSQLIRKNPAERPHSATEVLRQLDANARLRPRVGAFSEGSVGLPRAAIQRIDQTPIVRWWFILVVVAIGLGALGVGWYFWNAQPAASPSVEPASIAVLPFTDLSPSKDQDWMCDGIAEEIIDALCSITGLRVAARSSSFQFKDKPTDARVMTRTLGVSTLLEGSVRKVEDRLRVSARLVSSDGYELWSNHFDRGIEDAFAIQEEIARAVVEALRLRISATEAGRLSRSGTTNPQAYEVYLRGRRYLRALGAENGEAARQMFKRAIALDPTFAQPQAGLADADISLLQWLLVSKDEQPALRAEALGASEEALRLDPNLAEANVSRANVLSLLGRNDEADQSFRRATALSPGLRDAWYYYGRFLFSVQRYADAARAYEESAKRNPDDYDALVLVGMPYERLGEPAKARGARQRAVEAAERVLRNSPDDIRALYMSGAAMIALGERQKGFERLEQAVELKPQDFAALYNAACSFAIAGNPERALDMLDRAVGTGRGFRAWIERDPDLDSLRSLPRFKEILARLPP